MSRSIVRFSLNSPPGEKSSKLNSEIRNRLELTGFSRVGTGSWEANGDRQKLLASLGATLTWLSKRKTTRYDQGTLDHIWIYLDNPDEPDAPLRAG
jgi:hypothetical protein